MSPGIGGERLAIDGGEPVCSKPWPSWPVFDDTERKLLSEVLESGKWWYGDKVRQFESAFAALQGAAHGVTTTNGTSAIEAGLRALGVVEGDEVIVPPYSFIATASAVVTVGAIPVFADILPDSLCLDPGDVEGKVTSRTRAIVPVHVGGLVADMDRLNALARRHNLYVLEDAAHAWGSQLDGKGAGTLGNCGTFSFQVSKNITAGEGGILVTNDKELVDLCRSFTHCGRRAGGAWYDHDFLGSNLRMTEFQAAILLAQLDRLGDQIARREANARLLDEALASMSGIRCLAPAPRMTRRSYHMYIFRLEGALFEAGRNRFVEALNAEGVPASRGWYRPLYANGIFQNGSRGERHSLKTPFVGKGVDYTTTCCPVCERVCQDAVWIPQNVLLAEQDDILRAAEAIRKVALRAR